MHAREFGQEVGHEDVSLSALAPQQLDDILLAASELLPSASPPMR